LTPPPDHDNPAGWMVLQYVSPDSKRAVLFAYRLAGGAPQQLFRLRGLESGAVYRVRVDGQSRGTAPARALSQEGLAVRLDAEWRAAVIELEVVSPASGRQP